jgi:energy-coupling factor transporter ATP-binding protein EcfA2
MRLIRMWEVLDRVKVRNFQSLREVELTLGKFTVVLGASGTGKSAFLRSLLKMVRNEPVAGISSGEGWSHLPPAATNAEITLSVDGHAVKWVKGKDNRYIIDGAALNKVGKGCPDEVHDVLRMRELTFDGVDKYHLNFAQQFDMPFLLDDSGSKVAKILGEITNVNILYAANREANKKKLAFVRTLSVREDDLEIQKSLLEQFSSLAEDKERLALILKLRDSVDLDVARLKALLEYQSRLERLTTQVDESQEQLSVLQQLPVAVKLVSSVFESLATYIKMESAVVVASSCKTEETRIKLEARRLDPVRKVAVTELEAAVALYGDMTKALHKFGNEELQVKTLASALQAIAGVGTADVSGITADVERYKTLARLLSVADDRSEAAEEAFVAMAKAEEDVEVAKLEYDAFVAENPTCPFCGSTL